jgi:hypothetical protein
MHVKAIGISSSLINDSIVTNFRCGFSTIVMHIKMPHQLTVFSFPHLFSSPMLRILGRPIMLNLFFPQLFFASINNKRISSCGSATCMKCRAVALGEM